MSTYIVSQLHTGSDGIRLRTLQPEYDLYMDADGCWVMHERILDVNVFRFVRSVIRVNDQDPF